MQGSDSLFTFKTQYICIYVKKHETKQEQWDVRDREGEIGFKMDQRQRDHGLRSPLRDSPYYKTEGVNWSKTMEATEYLKNTVADPINI